MKRAYINHRFSRENRDLISYIDKMISEYDAAGYKLSVRQLYYQLVSRDVIPNTERSYKNTASLINDGRLAGLLDWDMIEDRGRDIEKRASWASGGDIVDSCARQFHMDLWEGQPYRPFVIVEKAALAGVMGRVCTLHDVPLLAAKGYPSVSVLRDLALYYIVPAMHNDQTPVILHLGDHDPSGIDMTRDLDDRLALFIKDATGQSVDIQRIALTTPQIEEKNPPPNPAKVTDSRFRSYSQLYGDESWELDALEPAYLDALVDGEVTKLIDEDILAERKAEIEETKAKLAKIAKDLK